MVSYMCQSQLSSLMLPSDAPMPPCAATVCERVGNTFDSTATDSPALASCSDARMPAPPAPTMTASKRRTGSFDEALTRVLRARAFRRPRRRTRSADDGERFDEQAHADRLDVVHPDVAHADPRVVAEAR